MKILFLSHWYPQPADNGSKIRIRNLLRPVGRRHDVTLVSFCDASDLPRCEQLPFVSRVSVCPVRKYDPRSFRARLGFLSLTPRYLIDTYSPEMAAIIRREARSGQYDLVIASQLTMASYHEAFDGVPAMLEEAELSAYLPPKDISWRSARRRLTWLKHRRYVAGLLNKFELCTVASEAERGLVAAVAPQYHALHVIPNFVDLEQYPSTAAARVPDTMIFTGSLRYGPNRDAVVWFAREIHPLIKTEIPDARLIITGDPGLLPAPEGAGIEYTGRVADVRPLVAASAVSIVPIRQGGGTRLKILEAMALRTPIVSTSKGVEGIEARDGVHLSIADSPQEFAQAVIAMLREQRYARGLADNAFSLLQSRYESKAVVPQFLQLVEFATGKSDGVMSKGARTAA